MNDRQRQIIVLESNSVVLTSGNTIHCHFSLKSLIHIMPFEYCRTHCISEIVHEILSSEVFNPTKPCTRRFHDSFIKCFPLFPAESSTCVHYHSFPTLFFLGITPHIHSHTRPSILVDKRTHTANIQFAVVCHHASYLPLTLSVANQINIDIHCIFLLSLNYTNCDPSVNRKEVDITVL